MTRRIIAYVAGIAGSIVAVFLLLPWPPSWPHLLAGFFFLIPGRVQGMLWRRFFRGRHALGQRDFAAAQNHFLAFLEALGHRPLLRHTAWLAWHFYTWNPEAMTRNNLGVCYLALGRPERAEAELATARDLDPGFPLPDFNLAVLAQHVRFSIDTNVDVFFCDPHSPWQRGSNENTNGLLRQYLPRTDDLSVYTQAQLNAVARELSGRPRQTLGWMKPSQVFGRYVASTV